MTSLPLEHEVIWLIGASYGIGEALAERLVHHSGAKVIISARTADKLHILADRLGERCTAIACDVTSHESVTTAYQQAKSAYGSDITMMIYCAGQYDPTSSAEFNMDAIEKIIDVNLLGAIRAVHTILPDFKANKAGNIVLFGSVAGYRGLPKAMGYGLSKAALIHLAENLRIDLDGSGVSAHIINPGFVKTRLTDKNRFTMPFRISPEQAAARIVTGLEKKYYEIHFPKRFTLLMKFLSLLPHSIYFRLISKL